MSAVPVLSAFYFGSLAHYRLLARHPRVVVDLGEHYVRQSFHTRTRIVGPNGVQDLVVQIQRRSGEKMPVHTVGLSHAETWPQQHLHAIRTAYGQSPWFEHFYPDLEELLLTRHERLADLDLATLRLGLKWLGLRTEVEVSESYVEVGSRESEVVSQNEVEIDSRLTTNDYRTALHPKRPIPQELQVPSYPQVFADRHGFQPGLSIIDLVCNCGPEAVGYLGG
ncbi:MAG: WbqC family protein [Flavobacteriales bacterium]|nr:WbqC family protein [Flavobacteriales bacterium]